MSNKKLIFGICVLAVVAAIFILSETLTSINPPEHRTKLFPGIEERHVAAIVINDGGSSIKLFRGCCQWKVTKAGGADSAEDTSSGAESLSPDDASANEEFPADSTLVQIAIERILSLKKGDLISDNPENQANYGVEDNDAGSSVELRLTGKKPATATLIVGKSGTNWNSSYVRRAGSNEVYLISGMLLRQALFFDIDGWKKKEPEPEPESINEEGDAGIFADAPPE